MPPAVWRIAWNTLPGEYIWSDTSKVRISSRGACYRNTDASANWRKASRSRSSGSARWTRIESIYWSVCPNLDNVSLVFVAQLVAQLAEGFELLRYGD